MRWKLQYSYCLINMDAKAKSNNESNLNDDEMKINFNEKKVTIFL